ncbi:MAG: AzlC family ABC transporter permease [bacterium]|nr:AzlC family ABC transporter permease [bacterium]
MDKSFLKGVRHGVPIALGYLSVSFAFGIQAVSLSLSPMQAVLISLCNVTSAGQLAGITLMSEGASLMQMALAQLTINLRYALMSLSISQKLDGGMNTLRRMLFAFCNTDEIFAVASAQPGKVGHRYLYGLMLMPYFGWALGTLLGAVAGQLLPLFFRTALGIAIYGMFIAIVIPPARERRPVRVVALTAAALSLALRYVPFLNRIGSGYAIMICAVAASCLGAALFPVDEEAGQ